MRNAIFLQHRLLGVTKSAEWPSHLALPSSSISATARPKLRATGLLPTLGSIRDQHTQLDGSNVKTPSEKGKERAVDDFVESTQQYRPDSSLSSSMSAASSSRIEASDIIPQPSTSHNNRPSSISSISALNEERLRRKIFASYPFLTLDQANFMAEIYLHLQREKAKSSVELTKWYQEYVWTRERVASLTNTNGENPSEGLLLESAPCLNLMLNFAYQRGDKRSILWLEQRARERSFRTPQHPDFPQKVMSIPGALWPKPTDEPDRLAFNFKIALAARFGLWTVVNELLDTSTIDGKPKGQTKASKRGSVASKPASSARAAEALNELGWGQLLRYGLGQTASQPGFSALPSNASTAEHDSLASGSATSTQGRKKSGEPSSEILRYGMYQDLAEMQRERLRDRLQVENKRQTEARHSATQRLLSPLLRFTSQETPGGESSAPLTTAPLWLLLSTLDSLAQRSETQEILRIARAALAEIRTLPEDAPHPYEESCGILHAVIRSCRTDPQIDLDQTLAIFAEFTGFDLTRRGYWKDRRTATESRGKASKLTYFQPNEDSLCIILMMVTDSHSRAGVSWMLYRQFRSDFPNVRITARTFRMLMLKTFSRPEAALTPAQALSKEDETHTTQWEDEERSRQFKDIRVEAKNPRIQLAALIRVLREVIDVSSKRAARFPARKGQYNRHVRAKPLTDWLLFLYQCRRLTRLLRTYRLYHRHKITEVLSSEPPPVPASMLNSNPDADAKSPPSADEIAERHLEKQVRVERHHSTAIIRINTALGLINHVKTLH